MLTIRSALPMIRNLFVDFTYGSIYQEDPVRVDSTDGTIIPVGTTNGEMLATEDAGMWSSTEWMEFACDFADAGWDIQWTKMQGCM